MVDTVACPQSEKTWQSLHAFMAACALALVLFVTPAFANPANEMRPQQPTLLLGIGAAAAPVFEGSDDMQLSALPFVALNDYYGFNFRPVQLSYNLLDVSGKNGAWSLRAGPAVGLAAGRDQDDDGDLRGLGDVDTGVMAGGFVQAGIGRISLGIDAAQEVADGHGGAVVGLKVATRLRLNQRMSLMPAVTGTWASDDYMQSFFGVTATQAAASNYATYTADAGFKDVGAQAALRYSLDNAWSLNWSVAYSRLIGDAADSPIVTGPGGTRDQITGRIGITRGFNL